jgi:hypothetical protein
MAGRHLEEELLDGPGRRPDGPALLVRGDRLAQRLLGLALGLEAGLAEAAPGPGQRVLARLEPVLPVALVPVPDAALDTDSNSSRSLAVTT